MKTRQFMPALLLSMLLAATAHAAEPAKKPAAGSNKPAATVNGGVITQAMEQALVDNLKAEGNPDDSKLRNDVREDLIKREVLAQEARKRGLDKKSDVVARIDLARQGILVNAYLEDYFSTHPIPETALKAEYDRQVAGIGDKEYKVRHIMLPTEAAAKDVITKLNAGGKFDDLVKDSVDTGSKGNGGDLGWLRPQSAPPGFAAAMTSQALGKYSQEPVKTDNGFHVLVIDEVRKPEIPPYESVRDRLRQGLNQQQVQQLLAELMKTAKIAQ